MGNLREVNGTYGGSKTPCNVLIYEKRRGGAWYCAEGSKNVNFTYDEIEEGVNIEELSDSDTMSATEPIETIEQLEAFIED